MKNFQMKKLVALISLAVTLSTSLATVAPAQAAPRAVCNHDRKSVSPCTQTVVATAGSAITATQALTTRGLSSRVSFALQRQTLPAGLTLNSQTGVISGTPTGASASQSYFIYVSSGSSDRRLSSTDLVASVTITVNPAVTNFTLTYNSNPTQSGLTSTAQTQTGSGLVTVQANTYTATNGAHFYGWNTQSDGKGSFYLANSNFTLSANTTLYAIWYFNVTITATSLFQADVNQAPEAWVKATLVSDPTAEVTATTLSTGESKIIQVIPYSTSPISVYFTGIYPEAVVTYTNATDYTGYGIQPVADLSLVGGIGVGILTQASNPTADGSIVIDTPPGA